MIEAIFLSSPISYILPAIVILSVLFSSFIFSFVNRSSFHLNYSLLIANTLLDLETSFMTWERNVLSVFLRKRVRIWLHNISPVCYELNVFYEKKPDLRWRS